MSTTIREFVAVALAVALPLGLDAVRERGLAVGDRVAVTFAVTAAVALLDRGGVWVRAVGDCVAVTLDVALLVRDAVRERPVGGRVRLLLALAVALPLCRDAA